MEDSLRSAFQALGAANMNALSAVLVLVLVLGMTKSLQLVECKRCADPLDMLGLSHTLRQTPAHTVYTQYVSPL